MTTGSWNRDNFVPNAPGWRGVKWSRSWSGADRPRVNRYGDWETYVVKRGDNSYKIRKRRLWVGAPPLKRAYDEEHAYTMQELYMSDEDVTVFRADGSTYTGSLMGNFGQPTWTAVDLLTANHQLKLLGKLREKLTGSDFNMSVFLGEGHKTLEMIGDTAIRIAKAVHHLRKGDLAGVARSLLEGTSRSPVKPYQKMKPFKPTAAAMSSKWLELQYGWKPLLDDTYNGMQSLAHQLSVPAQQTYRMSVRTESIIEDVKTGWKAPIYNRSVRVHRRSLKVIVSEHPSFLAKLGLTDPTNVAWELLPFSFVVDWFIPIGSYLDARAITSCIVAKYVTSDKRTGIRHTPRSEAFASKPRAYFKSVKFDRTISAAPKLPLPVFKPLSQVASWQHCANAVALVTQMATGQKVRK